MSMRPPRSSRRETEVMAEDHVAAPSDQPSGQVAVPGALSSSEVSGPWDPLPLSVVADLMARTERPWLIAGGHAIDLFVGRTTREHADIDVLLLRRDQQAVHEVLPGWETFAADPPGQLRPWPAGEILPDGVHDIWCRPDPGSPWQLQFMLDEAEGDLWVSRRNAQVRRPLGELRHTSASGFPISHLRSNCSTRPGDDAPRTSRISTARCRFCRVSSGTGSGPPSPEPPPTTPGWAGCPDAQQPTGPWPGRRRR